MSDVACNGDGQIPVMDIVESLNSKVDRAGDTMTGPLNVPAGGTGTEAIQAQEIDAKIALVPLSEVILGPLGKTILKSDGSQIAGTVIAACRFDGKATPPVLLGGANVVSVVRNSTGHYTITFEKEMDNADFTAVGNSDFSECHISIDGQTLTTMNVINVWHNGTKTNDIIDVLVFFGVN